MNDLYSIALAADQEYSDELEKVYGKNSCNARYDRKKNVATPKLMELGLALENANYTWINHLKELNSAKL